MRGPNHFAFLGRPRPNMMRGFSQSAEINPSIVSKRQTSRRVGVIRKFDHLLWKAGNGQQHIVQHLGARQVRPQRNNPLAVEMDAAPDRPAQPAGLSLQASCDVDRDPDAVMIGRALSRLAFPPVRSTAMIIWRAVRATCAFNATLPSTGRNLNFG